jgi:hypothetical protein
MDIIIYTTMEGEKNCPRRAPRSPPALGEATLSEGKASRRKGAVITTIPSSWRAVTQRPCQSWSLGSPPFHSIMLLQFRYDCSYSSCNELIGLDSLDCIILESFQKKNTHALVGRYLGVSHKATAVLDVGSRAKPAKI